MIQAILSYQYELNQDEKGDIKPEFSPITLLFKNEKFNLDDYSRLITRNDIFGVFYQHTSGLYEVSEKFTNFFIGKLKETPYQVYSYFKQDADECLIITITLFELDDDLEMFEDIIKEMGKKLDSLYESLNRAKISKKLTLIEDANLAITNELKFTLFQIERLSTMDKLQKIGLIFKNKERLEILKLLRELPCRSKNELKKKVENLNRNANIDVLLEPFLELNLIRRDWIKGEIGKGKINSKIRGEYIFLIKDFMVARLPHEPTITRLKEGENKLFNNYIRLVNKFIKQYDPLKQTLEESIQLTSILLKPDVYDFFTLMKANHYPLDKIPKILSTWADTKAILEDLQNLNIITVINGNEKKEWVVLFNDIQPIIFWPEYLLPVIRKAYRLKKITHEVARKAYDLMEVTYVENVVI
ncbi:MAG: hypothetical protein ACFFBP_10205 [Promethearchaeota archaeon]